MKAGVLCGVVALMASVSAAQADLPHVRHAGASASIVDGAGRQLLLRGVNVNALVEYNTDYREAVPLRAGDFHEMAALGFNFVRLAVSWSRIEPVPGRFSRAYLDEIARWVRVAEQEGIRVLVDFHQDRYNRHLWPRNEVDGAPDWATKTDGQPCTDLGVTTACAQAAETHFWQNDRVSGQRLQDHFLRAALAVSRRLRGDRALLGFNLWNEPTPGYLGSPDFEHIQLWPFYRRMIAGLRADGERRMIWFDPTSIRDLTDRDPVAARFSSDRNLVYAPHIYTDVFTSPGHPDEHTAPRLRASYDSAIAEARAYGAALVNNEWGGGPAGTWQSYRAEHLMLQDKLLVGSAFWIWKQQPGFYNWQVVEPNGSLRPDSLKAQQLAQAHVNGVPGRLLSTHLRAGHLTARIRGDGGTAGLWSGIGVDRGGAATPPPLTRARLDGRNTGVRLEAHCYLNGHTRFGGFVVRLRIPPGTHQITLFAAHSRRNGCRPRRTRRPGAARY